MAVEAKIKWQPIASLPDDRKDGRDMLFAEFYDPVPSRDLPGFWVFCVASFYNGNWQRSDAEDEGLGGCDHWADLNPPT